MIEGNLFYRLLCANVINKSMKRKSNKEFIKDVEEKHGDVFLFDKLDYKGNTKSIIIGCKKHNHYFSITPKTLLKDNFLSPCCVKELSKNNFIRKSKEVHNNFYSYDNYEFTNSHEKGKITCPIHGDFLQSFDVHIRGVGCPKCCLKNTPYSKEEFIEKAKEIHGDLYDYSKTEYVKSNIDVVITCPIHGDFTQKPYSHLSGKGCYKCYGSEKYTTDDFIKKSNYIHQNKYDYSECVYDGAHKFVTIICPKHGKFITKAYSHLAGVGCPSCYEKYKKFETEVYDFIKTLYSGFIIRCDRRVLKDPKTGRCKEIDIYLPELGIGVECDGEYWHEKYEKEQPGYHENKKQLFEKYGIHLIQIKYMDWCKKREQCYNNLKQIFEMYE